MKAVIDALRLCGVKQIEIARHARKVWRAINQAKLLKTYTQRRGAEERGGRKKLQGGI